MYITASSGCRPRSSSSRYLMPTKTSQDDVATTQAGKNTYIKNDIHYRSGESGGGKEEGAPWYVVRHDAHEPQGKRRKLGPGQAHRESWKSE